MKLKSPAEAGLNGRKKAELRCGNLAADRFIFLDDFLLTICPVCQNRGYRNARLKDESQCGFVLKGDGDSKIL